ncbi:MAG TPA: SCO family protein [Thermoanaerobaculia bacterium]|nr:SCO family protein [Thermoanaerobaculia bacterium]
MLSAALLAAALPAHAGRTWTSPTGSAPPASQMPGVLQQVRFDQRLGQQVRLDGVFRDEMGRQVRLGDYFGKRPVVLVLAYYHCPMLCDLVLSGVTGSLKALTLNPGQDFEVVVASIDPKETPELAADQRRQTLASYNRSGTQAGWHFLTGDQSAIDALTEDIGFQYVYDRDRDEYAHAAGITVLTPGGQVSRYIFGIDFPPRDVRLALLESGGGKIGSLVDQAMLYCFHYDPTLGRYSAAAMRLLRVAAALTLVGVVLMIVLLRRRETQTQPSGPTGAGPLGAA